MLSLIMGLTHCGSDSPTESSSVHTITGSVVLRGVETTSEGATVSPFEVADASDILLVLMDGDAAIDSTRSADGAFVFNSIAGGTYRLQALAAQQILATGSLFAVAADDTVDAGSLLVPDISSATLFPNPYTAGAGRLLSATGLPLGAGMDILSLGGNLVAGLAGSPGRGGITWDGTTTSGQLTSEGNYPVVATDESGTAVSALVSVFVETSGAPGSSPPAQASTPKIATDNLQRAFNERDKDLYETLLDSRFWFSETDCLGDFIFVNGLEEELEIVGGSRDGSIPGIYGAFRTIEWDFQLGRRLTELGCSIRIGSKGIRTAIPTRTGRLMRGDVDMILLQSSDEGFRISQTMTFKLRLGEDGLWRMARWEDDPIGGDWM